MTGATCKFCGEGFRNRQAVRAHLKGCTAYRQMPQASEPLGTEPKAPPWRAPRTPADRGRPGQRMETDETHPRQREEPPQDHAQEAEREHRRQQEELAQQRERDREVARLRGQQEAQAREDREAADRKAKDRRRGTIQRVKNRVIEGYWSLKYTIPTEAKAQAITEIEKELSKLPVDELHEAELVTIAEGIRDRIYKAVMQAQDRAKAEEERKHQQARRRAERIEAGVAYASQELRKEKDLDGWTRSEIEQKVKLILEQEIGDHESEDDVEALVDEFLDDELGEPGEDDEAD